MEYHQLPLTADIAPEDWAATPAPVKRLLENLLATPSPAQPLTARDRLLTQFLEALPIGVSVHDPTGQLIYINQAGTQIISTDRVPTAEAQQLAETFQIYRSTTQSLYPTEELPVIRALNGEIVRVDDVEIHHADRVIPLAVQAIAIRDEQGQPTYAIATYQDITDYKRAEEALRDSEERFRAFMDNSPTSAWITTAEGRVEYISNTYRQMFQVSDELIGRNLVDLYPPEFAEIYLSNIQTVTEQREVLETIEPGICADGRMGEFLVYKFPLPQPSGSLYVGGVAVDITEQRIALRDRERAEAALRASEEQLRLALDFTQTGIWDWDIPADRILWNRNHFYLLGLDPDTTIASYQNWRDRVHPEDLAGIEAALQEALHNQTDYKAEYRVVYPDGTVHWVWGKGRAIYNGSGQPTRMIGVMLDISDRKEAEEILRKQFNLLSLAQEAAQMGVYEWDLVINQAYWTPEMERLMGLQLEPHPNNLDVWFAQLHPSDRTRLAQLFPALLHSDQQPGKDEYRFYRNGEERWIDARGFILRDETGKALKMIGTNLDITDRKRAEAALYQREQEFRALAENAPDIIARFDRHLRHLYVNPCD